jgi:hypothetical protein
MSKISRKLQSLGVEDGAPNEQVLRLLTPQEIDEVSGGGHTQGIGSSYTQGPGTNYTQGPGTNYTQSGGGGVNEN